MIRNIILVIVLACLITICGCKNNNEEYRSGNDISGNQILESQQTELNKIIEKKIPNEIDIWQMKSCDDRFVYILTNDLNSYIYDYENDIYNLILSNENIEYVNILNVFPKSNKIYLDVVYKD